MLLLQLAVLGLVGFGLCAALAPKAAFVVRVAGGVPRVTKGIVTREFRHEISETCRRHRVKDGVIRGHSRGGRIALTFSAGIPTACRQQLRNLWALHA
jgi:Protein of unknown function (DUF3634)